MKNKYFDIHAPVFYPSVVLALAFIVSTLIIGDPMADVFKNVQAWITSNAGWFLTLTVNILLIVVVYIGISRYGKMRLGGDDAKPDFNLFTWFSMLFSSGMGIGLLFFGVAEPISNFASPPVIAETTREQAENALVYTYLHWGLHAWAVYAIIGLALAFFAFTKKMPLSIRSTFYPILGDRIHGPIGNIIDVMSVVPTLFGLATSLGLGVQQIATGLNILTGVENTLWLQVSLIAFITLAATASVVSGLKKGVKMLSLLNIRIALVFMVFILIIGPTIFILSGFIQSTGSYMQNLISIGTWVGAYSEGKWQSVWTFVYWAWWISWSPFVGMFIARISKGRTIRQFVFGVLLVPSLLIFLWMSIFGGTALYMEINGLADIISSTQVDMSSGLFAMLSQLPFYTLTSIVSIFLITIFFVTSSDSGSLVIDSITSGGKLDAPIGQRIFWALTEGGVAAALLIGGGLAALQTAALTTGLPFAFILLIMAYSLLKALKQELKKDKV